ncbi:MAG: efflux RND transporter permease subunit, partial [Planctomycetes bacterium]|nr:efflux RND transporter permease subunit [Planctomycetota bacterium]
MTALIRWAVRNTPAMNTLMIGILVVGAVCLRYMRREVFPEFELEVITIVVPYPGATPEEVEDGICEKIEEAVRAVSGIKKIRSVAREGVGSVTLELEADVRNVQKVLDEVRSEIDRIPSFPELAEDPEVKQVTLRREAIQVGVLGPETDDPEAQVTLRNLAERVREEILRLPSVSQAELVGVPKYEIDVEISEKTLRRYGLTLQDVARVLREQNLEIPGGTLKTDLQEVLLRGKSKFDVGAEIAKLPILTDPTGVVLTVGDLGRVRDEFEDVTALHRINGRPGLVIQVEKTAQEDLMAITDEVRLFVDQAGKPGGFELPDGYELTYWGDMSIPVRDRLSLLTRNGLQGLALVLIALAVFLDLRLAFWVAAGIPISLLGASALMFYTGQTLNMLSMFGFLMALGIVVDDAIVVGENIYAHRQMGKSFLDAAVEGTVEVLPSVIASVTTTLIAFAPLLFVPGVMGKFIAIMPAVVMAMLVVSLFEATFVLPCHLAHGHLSQDVSEDSPLRRTVRSLRRFPPTVRWTVGPVWIALVAVVWFFLYPFVQISRHCNRLANRGLRAFIGRAYRPMLQSALRYPGVVVAGAMAFLMVSIGAIQGGVVPFSVFPKLDSNMVIANIEYPDGSSAQVTDNATQLLEEAIWRVNDELVRTRGESVVVLTHRAVGQVFGSGVVGRGDFAAGSYAGGVSAELVPAEQRTISSSEIVALWRKRVLEGLVNGSGSRRRLLPAGYESLTFQSAEIGPGGAPIEFKLVANRDRMEELEEAVEACKARLAQYPGVFDIIDDSRPGKWEFQISLNDRAKAMGVTVAELAGTVRAAYYGEEVMRLQRGRHEVKLMVRYPREERRSFAQFRELRLRTPDGAERPLTDFGTIHVARGYSAIRRLDQQRAITITADVDEQQANAQDIITDFRTHFLPKLFKRYPGVGIRWEGQQERRMESTTGLFKGLGVALVVMFALLTLEFQTYLQPLIIMAVIPFGTIGAVFGHWVLGIPVTLFSLFGMVALTGVVVNDAIVLIDFMNHRVRAGRPLEEAILDAGQRRFRPVLLTSVTTVAALLPILLERSVQAQVVVPMATSLAFGLIFATVLTLILIPTFYLLYCRYIAPEERRAVPDRTAAPADRESEVP